MPTAIRALQHTPTSFTVPDGATLTVIGVIWFYAVGPLAYATVIGQRSLHSPPEEWEVSRHQWAWTGDRQILDRH